MYNVITKGRPFFRTTSQSDPSLSLTFSHTCMQPVFIYPLLLEAGGTDLFVKSCICVLGCNCNIQNRMNRVYSLYMYQSSQIQHSFILNYDVLLFMHSKVKAPPRCYQGVLLLGVIMVDSKRVGNVLSCCMYVEGTSTFWPLAGHVNTAS